jgi:hypothetical protein
MTATGPRSGDDTHDLIDDALHQLAGRRGACLGDPLAAFTLIASLIDQAERMIPTLAAEARDRDATWNDIATTRHQPRAGRTPLQPRLPGRRHQMAARLLTTPQTTQRNQA